MRIRRPDRYAHRLESARVKMDGPASVAVEAVSSPVQPSGERVAVLCPGPSLKTVWSDELGHSFDTIIAINDAAWLFRCHWIVASDSHIVRPIFERKQPVPLVGAYTNRAHGPNFEKMGLKYVRPETFNQHGPLGGLHTSYSMVAAIWAALRHAGVSGTVDVYGYDASDTPSLTGIDRSHSHRWARWKSEAGFLRKVWDGSRIRCHGRASTKLLDYVYGRTNSL